VKHPLQTRIPLKRAFSLPLLTFYGLGTIIGAGIYVLTGAVVANAGMLAPLSFLLASLLAAASAFSYAELAARFPLSAGEAVYVQRAFGRPSLARLVGLLIVMTGVVSTATLLNGFVGYARLFVDIEPWLAIVLVLAMLLGVAMWGITQSAWVAMLSTLVEMGGLVVVFAVASPSLQTLPEHWGELMPSWDMTVWIGVITGAFIAFYAYNGFEDIVNVAEEVQQPGRNLPLAVLLSLGVASLLYMAVALVVVLQVPVAELAESDAPLALVYERATGHSPLVIGLVSLAAVINGALIQIIMASRMLYGMASQGWLPEVLATVHPLTRTPLFATALIGIVTLVMALWLPLVTLAKLASFIILIVVSMVNLSLLRVKRGDPRPAGIMVFPRWVPVAGFIFSVSFILFQLWSWWQG
jgi:amino acid transporter